MSKHEIIYDGQWQTVLDWLEELSEDKYTNFDARLFRRPPVKWNNDETNSVTVVTLEGEKTAIDGMVLVFEDGQFDVLPRRESE